MLLFILLYIAASDCSSGGRVGHPAEIYPTAIEVGALRLATASSGADYALTQTFRSWTRGFVFVQNTSTTPSRSMFTRPSAWCCCGPLAVSCRKTKGRTLEEIERMCRSVRSGEARRLSMNRTVRCPPFRVSEAGHARAWTPTGG